MTNYYRPETIKQTLKMMSQSGAGAVPLYYPPRALHVNSWKASCLIDLSALPLTDIIVRKKEIVIGSMVTFETLAKDEIIRSHWNGVLSQAAQLSATMALRNLATVGGLLLHPNFPAEVTLVLLALEANVVLTSATGKDQSVPIETFLNNGSPELKPGELIKSVVLPLRPRMHCVLERVARTKSDASIVSIVAKAELTQKHAHQLRMAIFGASPAPMRFKLAEKLSVDQPLTIKMIETIANEVEKEAHPIADYRGSAEYRSAMAGMIAQRALQTLKQKMAA